MSTPQNPVYMFKKQTKTNCFRQPETNNSLIFYSKHTTVIKICACLPEHNTA